MDKQYLKKWIKNGYQFTAYNYAKIWRINAIHYACTFLTVFVLVFLLQVLDDANLFNANTYIGVVVTSILSLMFIIWSVLNLCITEANLAATRNTPYSIYKNLIMHLKDFRWLKSICFHIVYFSTICIGLTFLIVPGLYFIASSYFAYYVFIEENETILNSFKKSHKLTKQVGLHKIFGLFLALSIVGIIIFAILYLYISYASVTILLYMFGLGSSTFDFTLIMVLNLLPLTILIPFSSMINLNAYLSALKE